MSKFMTVDQVAERLQVNGQTIRRWLREGELIGIPFGGRTGWRITEEDLQRFIAQRRDGAGQGKATKKLTA